MSELFIRRMDDGRLRVTVVPDKGMLASATQEVGGYPGVMRVERDNEYLYLTVARRTLSDPEKFAVIGTSLVNKLDITHVSYELGTEEVGIQLVTFDAFVDACRW